MKGLNLIKPALFFCFCLLILPFFSCTTRITGSVAADGSATLHVNTSLQPRMAALIQRFAAAGGMEGSPELDGAAISASISNAPGVTSALLRNVGPAALEGVIRISGINEFLSATGGHRFIYFEQGPAGGRCLLNVNLINGPAVLEYLSPEISDYLNALMAPIATGEVMTKTEYLDLVTAVYNRPVRDEIAGSRIRASIDFPGPVVSILGGTFSGRRAEFDILLLDLLVLETPAVYEVTWRN